MPNHVTVFLVRVKSCTHQAAASMSSESDHISTEDAAATFKSFVWRRFWVSGGNNKQQQDDRQDMNTTLPHTTV